MAIGYVPALSLQVDGSSVIQHALLQQRYLNPNAMCLRSHLQPLSQLLDTALKHYGNDYQFEQEELLGWDQNRRARRRCTPASESERGTRADSAELAAQHRDQDRSIETSLPELAGVYVALALRDASSPTLVETHTSLCQQF